VSSQAYTEQRMPNHDQSYLLAHKIDNTKYTQIDTSNTSENTQRLTLAMAYDLIRQSTKRQ